ncbi:MAG TPA: hypothetical protein VMT61_11445 [Candidatus Binataceae bacterium]|nr:hypothetical protein [Candidatus Binataceae bacterium]
MSSYIFPNPLNRRFSLAGLLLLELLALPRRSLACAVCFASSSASVLHAFYLTTILLLLMPIGAVALVALVIRRYRSTPLLDAVRPEQL